MTADFRRFGSSENSSANIFRHLRITLRWTVLDLASLSRKIAVGLRDANLCGLNEATYIGAARLSLLSRWPVVGGLAEAATGLRPASPSSRFTFLQSGGLSTDDGRFPQIRKSGELICEHLPKSADNPEGCVSLAETRPLNLRWTALGGSSLSRKTDFLMNRMLQHPDLFLPENTPAQRFAGADCQTGTAPVNSIV